VKQIKEVERPKRVEQVEEAEGEQADGMGSNAEYKWDLLNQVK
jgi:hypothetical protein